MDSHHTRTRLKSDIIKSPDLRVTKWYERRLVLGSYSYSVKKIVVGVMAAVVFFGMLFFIVQKYRAYRANPDVAVQKEISSLTLKIGRSMQLPQGEQPILAAVSDRTKLKGQNFFDHAQNGDRVLIYSKAKKAILYRPASEKIIEVTNLTSGNDSSCPSQQ